MSSNAKPLRLRASLLRQEEERCIYCLDRRFVDVLLSVSERLSWPSTWIEENGDKAALTDEQHQVIERGIWDLIRCENLTDIQNQIEQVLNLVTEINNVGNNNCGCSCCCGGGTGGQMPPITDPTLPTVPTIPPSEPGEYTDIWLCQASNQVADNYVQFWRNVADGLELGAITASAIVEIAAAWGFTLPLAIIPGMVAILNQYGAEQAEAVADMFAALRDQIQEAIYNSTNPQEAYNAVWAIVSNATGYSYVTRWCGLMTLYAADWEAVYNEGSFIISGNYDCGDDEPPASPEGYAFVPAPIIDYGGYGGYPVSVSNGPEGQPNVMSMEFTKRFGLSGTARVGYLDGTTITDAPHPQAVAFFFQYYATCAGGKVKIDIHGVSAGDRIPGDTAYALEVPVGNGMYRGTDTEITPELQTWAEAGEIPDLEARTGNQYIGFRTHTSSPHDQTFQKWTCAFYWLIPS